MSATTMKTKAKHVSHNLSITVNQPLTVGQLKRMFNRLDVPDDTTLKAPMATNGWAVIRQASFCREAGELSLW